MNKFKIELDEEQLTIIQKSLDFYSRINLGQLTELTNPYMVSLPDANYNNIEDLLMNLKTQMFPTLPEKSYFSIRSKQISEPIRQAVDIFETINYVLNPEKNKPFHWSTEKDLPNIDILI